jgi:hypothetical protein
MDLGGSELSSRVPPRNHLKYLAYYLSVTATPKSNVITEIHWGFSPHSPTLRAVWYAKYYLRYNEGCARSARPVDDRLTKGEYETSVPLLPTHWGGKPCEDPQNVTDVASLSLANAKLMDTLIAVGYGAVSYASE